MSLLREMGYRRVRHYGGGIAEWREKGMPIETGSMVEPRAPSRSAVPTSPRPVVPSVTWRRRGSIAVLDLLSKTSYTRLFAFWLVTVLAFGWLYWLAAWLGPPGLLEGGRGVGRDLAGLATAIYFSFVTATSVGFGDVVPVGPARVLAVLEGVAGLLLIGSVVSKVLSSRQEEMLAEIHRIAYEDRLDRVVTNLHLVLTELQSVSVECASRGFPPERMLPRLEGATTIFLSELRAIHDLLYRPQQAPEPGVLQALLAGLAAALRELVDLRAHMSSLQVEGSSVLRDSLASVRSLAREICGECVPREYAPDMKVWMDRVQELAGKLDDPGGAERG